jgi:cytoskeletal protein CcmA (bactofilin family)
MSVSAGIGSSISIKGDVEAAEPLTVAGRVEGSIKVDGHPLTIAPGSKVAANVAADSVIVSGSVKGKVQAKSKIVLRETASLEGEAAAPSITIAEGATVHGRIETNGKKSLALAS